MQGYFLPDVDAVAAVEEEEEEEDVGGCGLSWSVGCPAFLRILLMEETEGMEFGSQTR